MLDTTTKPIITREDLKRMRALGMERSLVRYEIGRVRAWCVEDGDLEIDIRLTGVSERGVAVELQAWPASVRWEAVGCYYPTVREALDDLPRLRKIMDDLREGAWSA